MSIVFTIFIFLLIDRCYANIKLSIPISNSIKIDNAYNVSKDSIQHINKSSQDNDSKMNYIKINILLKKDNNIENKIITKCLSTYKVKRGDTLFYIGWITGHDYRLLAKNNNISEPYSIKIGQMVYLKLTKYEKNKILNINYDDSHQYWNNIIIKKYKFTVLQSSINIKNNWFLPTEGKIISNFSISDGGNKGVDISGIRGQAILATAKGKVVYAGNALRGYGNMIIIKHNNYYLSAYAHNDTLLVSEQQEIIYGQKIATMGSTGTNTVRLHFEIRYKGKSVNPLLYCK